MEVAMKKQDVIICFILILFSLIFVSTGSAQSGTCVVTDIQGSLATISCPGQGTVTRNVGGEADIYKVGDTIQIDNSATQRGAPGNIYSPSNIDPKSSVGPGRR
jgi:hypothetical protein